MIPFAAALALQSAGWQRRYAMGNSNDVSVVVAGSRLRERATIRKNAVLVPMRPIFEALGANVEWFPENRKVVAHKGRKTISLVLGEKFAYAPGPILLQTAPRVMGGRVMVPLRFVSESLGASVRWEPRRRVARVDLPRR